MPSFGESRCEGEVALIEEGGFDIGANVPQCVSMLFAERGNNLPLFQPTVSTLLHFQAAREVYFNSSLPGMQLHSGNSSLRNLSSPLLQAEPWVLGSVVSESVAFKGGDNCFGFNSAF